jgi:hypothetical protein
MIVLPKMTIDKVTVNLYKCCKCEYQWTSWNSNQGADEPLPKCCPECRSLRRNQRYLDEELVLLYRLQDQLYETNLIKESGEKIDFEGNEILRIKPYSIYPYY